MEDLELYLSMAVTILSLLASTIIFLMKFIKNAKAKKAAEQLLKISEEIIPFIEEAEKFNHYSGEEKKEYVMMKITRYALNKKINIDSNIISNKIEELIDLTKQVNINRSSKNLQKILTGQK